MVDVKINATDSLNKNRYTNQTIVRLRALLYLYSVYKATLTWFEAKRFDRRAQPHGCHKHQGDALVHSIANAAMTMKQSSSKMNDTVQSLEAWLKQHALRMANTATFDGIQAVSLQQLDDETLVTGGLPASLTYMSLFPDLVAREDAELDGNKLAEFHEKGRGLGAFIIQGYQAFDRPFDQLEPKELRAAFTLQMNTVSTQGQARQRYSGVFSSRKRPRGESPASDYEADKRLRQSPGILTGRNSRSPADARSGSPIPNRRASPSPGLPSAGGNGSPNYPSSPPLPVTGMAPAMPLAMTNRPPLPSGQPPLPPGQPPLPSGQPPLPPGRPPLPPGLPPKPTKVETPPIDEEVDAEDDFELSAQGSTAIRLAPQVRTEMLRAVKALIRISDWPADVKRYIASYRAQKYPYGNPFAVPLVRGKTILVPDAYFDRIEKPMDFSTIQKRIIDGYYLSYRQFCNDVRLVAENAVSFNTAFPGNVLAAHLTKRIQEELAKGQQYLLDT